jgi:hypothetical protein
MMHQSIATIDSPEFINLQPLEINPLMSRCEIKVLYLGENRNHSYITKEVAAEMAKTLRGAPIVGYYKEEKEDFRDHGEKVVFDDEGMKFECMTKPYGFVAPDAKVWFQKFEDTDEFGNQLTREYLMTTGYLWTGQFEEAKLAIDEGRPQSMELDVETLDGHWSTNSNTGMDFFIINDAIFSKLCILGEDVEPCFEGASVTAPEVSKNFSLDDDFRKTLYTMMQDLKFALEGGKNMDMEQNLVAEETVEEVAVEETVTEEVVAEAEVVEETVETETPAEEYAIADSLVREEETPVTEPETEEVEETVVEEETEADVEVEEVAEEAIVEEEILTNDDNSEQSILTETQDSIEDTQSSQENFAKSDDEEDKEDEEESKEEETDSEDEKDDEDEEDKKKDYSLIEAELDNLKAAYSDLESKYQALVEFKETVDNEKKDALIASFYMLSDEDKAEVVENKAKYSLEDIEAKLSVICVRKKVNFDLDDTSKNDNIVEEKEVMTYNVSDNESTSTPAWISALKNTRDNRK